MRFLLDTNVLIHAARKVGRVRAQLLLCSPEELATTVVTLAELLYGVCKSSDPQRAQRNCVEMLSSVPILDFTADCAAEHARIRYDLRHAPIGERDLLIAAVATTRGMTLVTHNHAEFARIPGLNQVDWY